MKNKAQCQSILEYVVLFAVMCVVVVGTTFIAGRYNTFSGHLEDMATTMAGDSFEASTIGGWE